MLHSYPYFCPSLSHHFTTFKPFISFPSLNIPFLLMRLLVPSSFHCFPSPSLHFTFPSLSSLHSRYIFPSPSFHFPSLPPSSFSHPFTSFPLLSLPFYYFLQLPFFFTFPSLFAHFPINATTPSLSFKPIPITFSLLARLFPSPPSSSYYLPIITCPITFPSLSLYLNTLYFFPFSFSSFLYFASHHYPIFLFPIPILPSICSPFFISHLLPFIYSATHLLPFPSHSHHLSTPSFPIIFPSS